MVKELQTLGLVQRLETMEGSREKISDKRFDSLMQRCKKMGKDDLINMQHSI